MHLMYRALSVRLSSGAPKNAARAMTAKEAIWAIKRDCLMLCSKLDSGSMCAMVLICVALILGGILLAPWLVFRLILAF